jgi:tRNA-2-methylthio-N6-dimethylallyladenosine synthase
MYKIGIFAAIFETNRMKQELKEIPERKLYIETYGCQMNVADSEVVLSVMQTDGYMPTEHIGEADAIFVNTCSVARMPNNV